MNIQDLRLQEWYFKLESEFISKTPRSMELYKKARSILPSGVSYSIRYMAPYPIYIAEAKATRIWDIDGNEYIDYWMGHGVHLLGHLPEVVVKAVKDTLNKGTHYGFEYPEFLEYIELLLKVIPNIDMVRFTNSGTEANMYAIRLSRAYTGRKYIVKIEGGWHGGVEALQVGVTYPYDMPESAGILEEAQKYTLVVPFNDIYALEQIFKKYEVASVILEPVMGAAGCIHPDEGYLREVRKLVDEHGSLLIFDEVITGFRLAPGGAQEYYGVKADIVVLGKALGGGVGSVGAFASRNEIMGLLDHVKYPRTQNRVFHGGTFVANSVVTSAGYAMIKFLVENKGIYESAGNRWIYFRRKIEEICRQSDLYCWSTGEGTLSGIHFTKIKPRNARDVYEYRWSRIIEKLFHLYARINGIVYVSEKLIHLLPSLIHDQLEVERFIATFSDFIEKVYKLIK